MPLEPNRRYEEAIDISYITYDCFHFSQKGHALGRFQIIFYYHCSKYRKLRVVIDTVINKTIQCSLTDGLVADATVQIDAQVIRSKVPPPIF